MMIWKFSILIIVLIGNSQRSVQKTNFKDWTQNVIDDQFEAIAKAKRNIASGIKNWIIVEPTERETVYVDEAMCSMFSLGTDNLLDTDEKMHLFCQERNTYIVESSAWVIRKFTFHLNIRVFMNIVLNNIRKKTDLYCADETFKQNYVRFFQNFTAINPKLSKIRMDFVDTLVSIQKSKIGITKIPNFCCGYWRYKNQTLEAIDPKLPELKDFIKDMMNSFFKDSINLLCLPFSINSQSICSYYPGDHAEGQIRQSILMNMVEAISKITYIVL